MKPLYWTVRKFFQLFMCAFYQHKVYGLEHIVGGKAIIAPNHTSFFDPPAIAVSWPEEVSFLARKSLFASKIIGPFIKRLNSYPVAGTTQDLASIKLICQLLRENHKVVIFPTGVRSYDGSLGIIKSGVCMIAMRCHAPIIPVYIHGTFEAWDRTHRWPKLKGHTACVIGSPIDSKQFEALDKKAAQEAMAAKLRESLEALKAWYDAGAHGSPP